MNWASSCPLQTQVLICFVSLFRLLRSPLLLWFISSSLCSSFNCYHSYSTQIARRETRSRSFVVDRICFGFKNSRRPVPFVFVKKLEFQFLSFSLLFLVLHVSSTKKMSKRVRKVQWPPPSIEMVKMLRASSLNLHIVRTDIPVAARFFSVSRLDEISHGLLVFNEISINSVDIRRSARDNTRKLQDNRRCESSEIPTQTNDIVGIDFRKNFRQTFSSGNISQQTSECD